MRTPAEAAGAKRGSAGSPGNRPVAGPDRGGLRAEAHGLWSALGYPAAEEESLSTSRDAPRRHP